MKSNILYLIAISALLATSCSKQSALPTDTVTDSTTINFAPQLVQQTKGGHLDHEGGFSVGDVIGVFGYQKANGAVWANDELPSLMHNVTLTKQSFDTGSGSVINYVYYPQKLWPDMPDKARFFAYYPHNSSVPKGTITPSDATYSGFPFVDVALGLSQTPVDFVTAQTELVDRTQGSEGGAKEVALTFAHRLSQLMFKAKASGLTAGLTQYETRRMYINRLSINNIYNKARYTFDDNADPLARGTWSDHSHQPFEGSTGSSMPVSSMMAAISETSFQDIIDPHGAEEAYLLMIPQKFDNVEFEVTYTLERLNENGGCEDHTIVVKRIPVSADWEAGKVYTYFLEFGFSEIDEGGIDLTLSVKPWIAGGYDIEMGR